MVKRKKAWIGALIGAAVSAATTAASISAQNENMEKQLAQQRNMTEGQRMLDIIRNYNQQLGQGQDIYRDIRQSYRKGGKCRVKKDDGGTVGTINTSQFSLANNINPTLEVPTLIKPTIALDVNRPDASVITNGLTAQNLNIQSNTQSNANNDGIWTPADTSAVIAASQNAAGSIMNMINNKNKLRMEMELNKEKFKEKVNSGDINMYGDRFRNAYVNRNKLGGKIKLVR